MADSRVDINWSRVATRTTPYLARAWDAAHPFKPYVLVLPDSVRRFVRAILSFFEGSGGDAVLRVIGFLTVVLGAALIYVGVFVV